MINAQSLIANLSAATSEKVEDNLTRGEDILFNLIEADALSALQDI